MKLNILLLFFVLSLSSCTSDEFFLQIQGIVTDISDGSPIQDAQIRLYSSKGFIGGIVDTDWTDENGFYSVETNATDCSIRDLSVTAEKALYEYTINETIQCIDEIQTIDFIMGPE